VSLHRDNPTILKPGTTFHVPPILREPGKHAFGASETVLAAGSEYVC